ncbi:hypothetical protein KY284_017435 [Solanum tuberosum]|nr:hypothetical protein KY284_017435 [Solanum tuberosum]
MQASTNLCEPTGANVVAVAGYKTLLMELFCRVLLRLYYSNLEDKVLIRAGGIVMNESVPVLTKQPTNTILSGSVWDPDVDKSFTGGDATKLFAMSNLPCQELKQIN